MTIPSATTGYRPRRRRGFSLLEVLIALVLTGIVTAGVSMALRTGLDASARIRERSDAHSEARAALDVLSADLRSAYLSGVNLEKTYFSGEQADEVPPGESFLRLTTLSYRRSLRSVTGAPTRTDAIQVEYMLQAPLAGGPKVLVRRERWPTETGQGVTEVVCERVASIRLRYLGQDGYERDWSADPDENPKLTVYTGEDPSAPQRELPKAVEITLLLAPPPGAPESEKPRSYRTLVQLETDAVMPFESEVVPKPQAGGGQGGAETGGGGNPGG